MQLHFAPYEREFAEPYRYGNTTLPKREGVVLRGESGGRVFYSEASPLPGHSLDTVASVLATLREGPPPFAATAALGFGLAGLRAQESLAAFGAPIFSNALLPWRGLEATRALAQAQIQAGYTCLKLKILESALSEQLAFLREFPATKFRLDANGALSSAALAQLFQNVNPAQIDYLEEPGQWDDPLLAAAPISLAADETAAMPRPAASVVVIKPTVHGSLRTRGQHRVIYTTTLEAEPGRRALIALLARSSNREIAGLSTGFLFRENFLPDQPRWDALPAIGAPEQAWLDSLRWEKMPS